MTPSKVELRKRKDGENASGSAKSNVMNKRTEPKKSSKQYLASEKSSFVFVTVAKWSLLLFLAPPFINYAAVQQEKEVLQKNVVTFDIGFGQKLQMECTGVNSKKHF